MSSWPVLNHDQAKALARFINTLRPDWDVPGVIAQLGYARDKAPGPDLAIAAIRAAMSAHNRTPAVIGLDGEHWRSPTPTTAPRPIPPAELCQVCGLPEPRCQLLAKRDPIRDGHRFEPPGEHLVNVESGELEAVDHTARAEELRQLMQQTADALAVPQ